MVSVQTASDPAADAIETDPGTPETDPSGLVPEGDEGVAGAVDEGTVAEVSEPLWHADVSDDDLIAQLRERKNGDGLSLEDRMRKSERDRYAAEERRRLGTVESVQRRTSKFLQKYGIDSDDVNPDDLGELNALSELAHLDALGNTGEAWVRATAAEMGMSEDPLLAEALAKYRDDPSDIDSLASRMLLSMRDTVSKRTLAEASPEDVPDGSQLKQWLNTEASRLADAELVAREVALQQKDSPPTAPVGAPNPIQDEKFSQMTVAEVSYLPDVDRALWRDWRGRQPK